MMSLIIFCVLFFNIFKIVELVCWFNIWGLMLILVWGGDVILVK